MSQLLVVPDVFTSDGRVLRGTEALGTQHPRFWTAPARHRDKDPACAACQVPGYTTGCGEFASSELLEWAAGYGYELDPWQQWWLAEACGTNPDGRWSAFECMLIVSRQNGKNQAISTITPVLTVNRGWQAMGALLPGDFVYGSDGQPTRVTAVTGVFRDRPCYAVTFTDGSVYTADEDHLWHVRDTGGRWQDLTTGRIAGDFALSSRDTGRKAYRYRVRCDAVPDTPEAALPIDPYLLGYWLGDGYAKGPVITCGKTDLEWVQALVGAAGATASAREQTLRGVWDVRITLGRMRDGFESRCRRLGVWGNKHIPEIYLTASPAQRLALLRGLMDSDGSIAITNRSPQVEFTASNPRIAEGFHRLARSLGIRVTRRDRPVSLNGQPHRDQARFLWTPPFNPFALPRKAERWRPPVSRRHELMSITDVRLVPSVPVRCITVAAKDGVFLLGHTFTPTHNCLEVRELGGLFLLGERMLIHTAHEFKAAAEHFRRVRDTVTSYDDLRRRVKSVTTSHGDEAIELRPVPTLIFGAGGRRVRKSVGARLRFLARSRGSGRSFTADLVVYDEAMILSDEQVGASMPTMSAVPNPQMIYTASAGYPDSVQLGSVRRRVLRKDPTLMGAEWSISPHLDTCHRDEITGRKENRYVVCGLHDDRDTPLSWAKANPALNVRLSPQHVAKEMAAMSMSTFDRERLGVGDWPSEDESWSVVTLEQWQACAMPDPGGATRPVAFAFDIDPDMISATIASCWYRPGAGRYRMVSSDTGKTMPHPAAPGAESEQPRPVVEIPRGCSREGTAWVIPRLVELRRAWKPIAIIAPKNGPAAGLVDEAVSAGLDITWASSADEAAAFSLMVTTIRKGRNGGLIHLGQELAPGLWTSVASAETRVVGDGGQAWCRRDSDSDITPVTTTTLAHWALNKRRRSYDPVKSVAGSRQNVPDWMRGA